jgi:hypothetical protein
MEFFEEPAFQQLIGELKNALDEAQPAQDSFEI